MFHAWYVFNPSEVWVVFFHAKTAYMDKRINSMAVRSNMAAFCFEV